MKMNKKGFTLIEMLVVIAIIAVLVSIIIPTVGSATTKAEAAADAANLRSAKATLSMALVDGSWDGGAALPTGFVAPESKSGDGAFGYTCTNDVLTVYFGSAANDIAHYADIAEDGRVGS